MHCTEEPTPIAEEELAGVPKHFKLTEVEKEGVEITTEDIKEALAECKKSLFGKVVSTKSINFNGIRNYALQTWRMQWKMTVIQVGNNLFQFVFSDQNDKRRILAGGPYLFDNQLLNVKDWHEDIDRSHEAFATAAFWVQLWNLPVQCQTKECGYTIGAIFPKVLDVIIPEGGNKDGRYIKVKVEVDLRRPLLRGTTVHLNGTARWIAFKYERCPNFCYSCGIIGHNEKDCNHKAQAARIAMYPQYGCWMRANGPKNAASSAQGGNGKATLATRRQQPTFSDDHSFLSEDQIAPKMSAADQNEGPMDHQLHRCAPAQDDASRRARMHIVQVSNVADIMDVIQASPTQNSNSQFPPIAADGSNKVLVSTSGQPAVVDVEDKDAAVDSQADSATGEIFITKCRSIKEA